MATRVGKYKVSKKESALSIVDGGTVTGDVTFDSNSTTTLAGTTTLSNATVKITGIPSISQSNVTAAGQLFTTASHLSNATVKFTGLATNAVSTSLAANQLFRTQSEFLTASNAGAAANSVGKNFDVLCVTR